MSLINLLAASRSFGKVESEPTRYRMRQGRLLPKFGPRAVSEPRPHWLSTGESVGSRPQGGREEPRYRRRESASGKAAAPASAPVPRPPPPGVPQVPMHHLGSERRRRRGILGWFLRRRGARPSPFGRSAHEPVQGELRLESVRPVRNDLSEADFELERPPGATPEPKRPSLPPASAPQGWWRRLWRRRRR